MVPVGSRCLVTVNGEFIVKGLPRLDLEQDIVTGCGLEDVGAVVMEVGGVAVVKAVGHGAAGVGGLVIGRFAHAFIGIGWEVVDQVNLYGVAPLQPQCWDGKKRSAWSLTPGTTMARNSAGSSLPGMGCGLR